MAQNEFTTLQEIRTDDGVLITITERDLDGRISFSIAKEFDRGGKVNRTHFMNRRQLPTLIEALEKLGPAIEQLEDASRARRRNAR